ncbi:8234_t:CDS:2 [Entrophospora sp. SA101]|nr:8234_t:CDS:2 [Entrophospora sp. SA101]
MKLKNSPYKKSKLFLQIDRDTNNNGSPFRKVISDSFKEARISSSPSPSTPCASSSIFKKYNTSKCPDILYDQTNEGNNSNLFDDYNNSTTSCKLIGSRSNNTLLLTQKASASKVTLSSTVLLSNKENPDDISIDNDLPENLTLKTSNNYYYSNQSNYNDNNNYINNVNNSRCNLEPVIILDDDDNQKVKNKTNNRITDLNSFLKVGENNNKDNVHLENLLKKPSSNQAGSNKRKLVNTTPKGFNLSKKSIQPLLNRVNGEPALKFSGVKKRQSNNMNIDKRRNFTVPKPFKFHGSNYKSAAIIDTTPIIPLAERIKLFMERTPERYKSKVVKFHPTSLSHNQLTRPRSPNLLTKLRAQHIR